MTRTTHYLQESLLSSLTGICTILSPFLLTTSLLSLLSQSLRIPLYYGENFSFHPELIMPIHQKEIQRSVTIAAPLNAS